MKNLGVVSAVSALVMLTLTACDEDNSALDLESNRTATQISANTMDICQNPPSTGTDLHTQVFWSVKSVIMKSMSGPNIQTFLDKFAEAEGIFIPAENGSHKAVYKPDLNNGKPAILFPAPLKPGYSIQARPALVGLLAKIIDPKENELPIMQIEYEEEPKEVGQGYRRKIPTMPAQQCDGLTPFS